MIGADRLADYLAGTLPPDEQRLVAAELARDPDARAALDALRRSDAALAAVPPTPIPEGFEARLHARLQDELAASLSTDSDAAAGPSGTHGVVTPLRRRPPTWVTGLAAAAAGVLVVAGVGLTTADWFGGGDDGEMATDDSRADGDAPVASLALPESAEPVEPGAGEAATSMMGPVVIDTGRPVDDAVIDEVLGTPALQELVDRQLDATDGTLVAEGYRGQLTATGDEGADAPARADTPTESTQLPPVRCADVLVGDPPPIIAYVELAIGPGGAAVTVFGVVTATDGTYAVREVHVLDTATCEVLDVRREPSG